MTHDFLKQKIANQISEKYFNNFWLLHFDLTNNKNLMLTIYVQQVHVICYKNDPGFLFSEKLVLN